MYEREPEYPGGCFTTGLLIILIPIGCGIVLSLIAVNFWPLVALGVIAAVVATLAERAPSRRRRRRAPQPDQDRQPDLVRGESAPRAEVARPEPVPRRRLRRHTRRH